MSDYQVMGDAAVKTEFTEAHCQRLHQWYSPDGVFLPKSTAPGTREMLWNCFSLLHRAQPDDVALAEQIIRRIPIDHNHFTPIVATEMLIRHADDLAADVVAHLREIVLAHLGNMIEVRFGSNDTHNFTGMGTFLLLGAAQLFERYRWEHPLAGIPEIYTGDRLLAMGMNALQSFAWKAEHADVFTEFNSPTYSPITAHMLAKIVELVDDPEAKAMALELEQAIWRELLGMYHPELSLPCAPYSRAYRVDVLGQNSQMRILMCYLGLSCDRSVPALLDDSDPDLMIHHDGDVPFTWSGPAWQMATTFHVPKDALAELRARTYPHVFEAKTSWGRTGYVDKVNRKWVPVQGSALPGGTTDLYQEQHPRWAVGYRSLTHYGQSMPLMLHYALAPEVASMRDVRTVTLAVSAFGATSEWVPSQKGGQIEAGNTNNGGPTCVRRTAPDTFEISSGFFPQMSMIAVDELSLSACVPTHFVPVDRAELDGRVFTGDPIEVTATRATCRISDHGFVYEVELRAPRPVTIRLWKWSKFIRVAAFWYTGEKRHFSEAELAEAKLESTVRLVQMGSA